MKRISRHLLALGMVGALLGCSALAAEEPAVQPETQPAIAVQLDGQTLTFTDAVPQVVDQRTFLPFRAVFEAMGAEVSNEGSVITATRGDTTLTMTLDETTATVTRGGVEVPLTMDVAPYVDNESWRTYVPVRFAAQAFGCSVGWDQATSTAIIVDTEKLMDEALEGKEFTYLEKLAAYSQKYNEGIWDMTMDFDGTMTMLGAALPFEGDMAGTMADTARMSMDMNMKLDMKPLIQTIAPLTGQEAPLSPEDQATLDALANEGLKLAMRGDLESGKFYMNMEGSILKDAGMEENTWYLMDMNALYAQAGMDLDWAQLLETSRSVDYTALAKAMVAQLTPNTASEEGYGVSYGVIKESVENVIFALSDGGFTKEGDTYTTLLDGGLFKVGLKLTMKKDAITAYTMDMSMFVADEASSVSMTMTTSMDDKDQMTAQLAMDVTMTAGDQTSSLLGMEMNMAGGYTPGKAAPETEPPEGALVKDLMELVTPTGTPEEIPA